MNFIFRIPHLLFFLCPFFILTSCGFHFRNTSEIPYNFRSIELNSKTPYAPLEVALKRHFLTSPIHSKNDTQANTLILEIMNSEVTQRPRAIRGDKRLEEIEITYQTTFRILKPGGEVLNQPTTLSRSESMLYNRNFALGKQYELEELERELALQLVEDILYRLLAIPAPRSKALISGESLKKFS